MDQVLWAIGTRFAPERDIDVLTDTWSTYLDPSRFPNEERPYGAKMLLDATIPHRHYEEFPDRSAVAEPVYKRIQQRWQELGFEGEPPELPLLLGEQEHDTTPATDGSTGGM
jgi:4-hydroxy-3-polyprenylbenzoate decarboxylase